MLYFSDVFCSASIMICSPRTVCDTIAWSSANQTAGILTPPTLTPSSTSSSASLITSLIPTLNSMAIVCLFVDVFSVVCQKATPPDSEWMHQWTRLNVARGILAILGWFVVSLWPYTDRLSKSLLKANDDILQPNTVTGKLQATEGNSNLWSTHNTTRWHT